MKKFSLYLIWIFCKKKSEYSTVYVLSRLQRQIIIILGV